MLFNVQTLVGGHSDDGLYSRVVEKRRSITWGSGEEGGEIFFSLRSTTNILCPHQPLLHQHSSQHQQAKIISPPIQPLVCVEPTHTDTYPRHDSPTKGRKKTKKLPVSQEPAEGGLSAHRPSNCTIPTRLLQ